MNGEIKKNNNSENRWHFWFLVASSAFLVVTFGLYVPLRFQHQVLTQEHGEARDATGGDVLPHEAHEPAQYHEEGGVKDGLVVNLNATPVPFEAETPLRLDFFVNRKPNNVPVTDLEISHEKVMHVIGARNDLNEFLHIHPDPTETPGLLSVNHTFSKPGLYKIWSEIKTEGTDHVFGHPELAVEGTGERFEKKVDFGRNKIIGDYQVALRLGESVRPRKDISALFDIHTLDSEEVELENYLGAPMHLTVIKDDWRQFIHTHPEGVIEHTHAQTNVIPEAFANGGGHDTAEGGHGVAFVLSLPEPGLYKAFAQFRPEGINLPPDEALLAEFWIRAEEGTGLGISAWWFNLTWAIAAIAIVSRLVSRFLRVRP